MAQYKTGTVDVTNGSANVVGHGTAWLANAAVGNSFKIQGSSVIYTIAAIGTDTGLTISPVYAGATAAGQAYVIAKDYTPNLSLYEPDVQDTDWPVLLREALRKLDGVYQTALSGHTWKGVWSDVTNYNQYDGVSYNGSSWMALRANIGVTPVAGADWLCIALRGETGNPYKAYATLAAANADLANIPADALVWVNADTTAANIGYWVKTSGVLVQSSYDRVARAEAKDLIIEEAVRATVAGTDIIAEGYNGVDSYTVFNGSYSIAENGDYFEVVLRHLQSNGLGRYSLLGTHGIGASNCVGIVGDVLYVRDSLGTWYTLAINTGIVPWTTKKTLRVVVTATGWEVFIDNISKGTITGLTGKTLIINSVGQAYNTDNYQGEIYGLTIHSGSSGDLGPCLPTLAPWAVSASVTVINKGLRDASIGTTHLAAKSVTAAKIEDAITNKLERSFTRVNGRLTKNEWSAAGATRIISFPDVYIVQGFGATTIIAAGQSNLAVPTGKVVYADLAEIPVAGKIQARLSDYDIHNPLNPAGFLKDDRRIPLFINVAGTPGGPLYSNGSDWGLTDPRLGNIWLKASSTMVSWDADTRTLGWTGDLISPISRITAESISPLGGFLGLNSPTRVKILAGEVSLPDLPYQVVYLDLTAGFTGGGDFAATAVKVGQYYQGATQFRGLPDHLALYYYNGAADHGPVGGFPQPPPPPAGPAPISLEDDDIVVVKTLNEIKFYIKGSAASERYLEYRLKHTVVPYDGVTFDGNSDHWRFYEVYEVTKTGDFTFTQVVSGRSIVNAGEWECAIKETGAVDFVGGYHGDEVLTMARLLVDGVEVALDTVVNMTCKRIQFIQKSNLYRCNTQTQIATHLKVYDITAKDGIILSQEVVWTVAGVNVTSAFLAMLPIMRDINADGTGAIVTDKAFRDNTYELEDVSTAGFTMVFTDGTKRANIWGSTSGISAQMDILSASSPSARFNISNAVTYNKFYYDAAYNKTTSLNEKWTIMTRYRLNTSN